MGTEDQLENIYKEETGEGDDDYILQLENFRKHPLNVNRAEAEDLRQLLILSEVQIKNLISYRSLLGFLLKIYELQAVPGWHPALIRKLLPYITIMDDHSEMLSVRKRFKGGEHSLVFRIAGLLEKQKGYSDTTATGYKGNNQRVFIRYRYNFKNLLQFGIVADKDAGEQFFGKYESKGFDFYSAHIFIRKAGIIESIAIGDYSVNMGQGLIQWHNMGTKKSSEVISIKRQAPVLVPYRSAGEFFFFRGAGITFKKRMVELTMFFSLRKLDANLSLNEDEKVISSFLTAGYHRTLNEINKEKNSSQQTTGIYASFHKNGLHVGLNLISHRFSAKFQKRDEPYNLYSLADYSTLNSSADYSYTFKNIHFFGEVALDKQVNIATVNAAILSVSSEADISLLYRNISPEYSSVYGNAFTENTTPVNENGLYAGISVRPSSNIKIDAYADLFIFPWLKYLVDAPGRGSEYLLQLFYTPKRGVEIYSRFRIEKESGNAGENITPANIVELQVKKNWRVHLSYKLSPAMVIRSRVEAVWVGEKGLGQQTGFMFFADLLFKPLMKPYSLSCRTQFFETDGYDSRIYAYENDVMYSYSIPAVSDSGFRTYINFNIDLGKRWSVWLRGARSFYPGLKSLGTGQDASVGNSRSEWKMEFRYYI